MDEKQMEKMRNELVVKDNRLLQAVTRRKYELTVREQKIIGFLLSLIKPEDVKRKPPYMYIFDVRTFCDICGIEHDSGSNVQSIKNTLESLASDGFWLDYGEGTFYYTWITSPDIQKGNGKIQVEISSKVFPYLVGLTERFTQYELWQILALKSTYSIALFEYLRSYLYKHTVTIPLDQLRAYLGIEEGKYSDFKNFKQKVLNVAKREINELTDMDIDWKGIRDGRSYGSIEFTISQKKSLEAFVAYRRGKALLDDGKRRK